MSANKNANTLLRQQTLLKCIPTDKGIRSTELLELIANEGFNVSHRTLQRDLDVLSQYFPIYSETEEKPYLWRSTELGGLRTHIDTISLTDALSLMLVEKSLKQLLPPAMQRHLQNNFEHSRQLLNTLKDDYNAQWLDKVASVMPDMGFKPPVINEALLKEIQEALLRDQTIRTYYQAKQKVAAIEYHLMPLALVQRGDVLYLIAQDITKGHENAAVKRFVMHRFQTVKRTYEQGIRPADFNLQQYIQDGAMHFSNGEALKLKAKVTAELAFYLTESPMSDDMVLMPLDEHFYELTATVHNSWQLNWWLKGQGANIAVLEPQSLRTQLSDNLRKALEAYGICDF